MVPRVIRLSLVFCHVALCQNVITTFAGTEWLFPSNPQPALNAPLAGLTYFGVAADSSGNYFIADTDNLMVMKVGPDGTLSVFAGNGIDSHSGDGGQAVDAGLAAPSGVAVDSNGNVYISEFQNGVRKVTPGGIISTIAGTHKAGFSGDGGPATSATLNQVVGVAVDNAGNVYIADYANNRIRKVTPAGIITTIAGNGKAGFSGDGGPATSASLNNPYGVAVDLKGNVYIADYGNFAVRKVAPDGTISTVAGRGSAVTDGGPAVDAFMGPVGVAVDAAGNLYIADLLDVRIAKVDTAGIITTVAGNDTIGYSGDGGPAADAVLNYPQAVALDNLGSIYIADGGVSRIRRIGPDGIISTVAGNGQFRTGGDGGPATSAALYQPTGAAVDSKGNFYTVEPFRNRVRKVAPDGTITPIAGAAIPGDFSGDGGPAIDAHFNEPYGVAVDSADNIYITDGVNARIRKITPDGIINTIAGTGDIDTNGDGGPATQAAIKDPRYIAFDKAGNLYFSDGTNRVRKITAAGIISTVAGNGRAGYSGDGSSAARAGLNNPYGVAVDSAGNLYIGDYSNNRVRKVDSAGIITTVAGNGVAAYSGDGGPATSASLHNPAGIYIDKADNLYIADEENYVIRVVTTDGIINTIAGTGIAAYAGDGGEAIDADLSVPTAVTQDSLGNLFIADWFNNRIRVILSSPPTFQLAPAALSFEAAAGGPVAASQNLQLNGTVAGLLYTATASTADGANWLQIANGSGTMPIGVQVSADPTGLAPGAYQGTITITAPDSVPPVRTVAVAFAVDAAVAPQMGARPGSLTFTLTQGSAAATQTLTVSNDGGGSLNFSVVAATASGGAWLSASPSSGTASATAAATVAITANPGNLAPGTYSGAVALTSATTGQTIPIQVTMTVSAIKQTILLPQSGLTFTAVAGGGAAPGQSFEIRNIGQGSMNWSVAASTLSGGTNWLAVNPASGSSAAGSAGLAQVNVSIDTTGLDAGQYYGQIRVTAPGADNSPQTLSVVLNVLSAGSDPGPIVQPAGLIFTGVAGGEAPGSQNVLVSNLTSSPIAYASGRLTLDGANWFVHLPTAANVTPDQSTRIVVQPDQTGLTPGVYRGTLTLLFPGGVTRAVNLLFVVIPASGTPAAGASQRESFRIAAAGCAPSRLVPLFTQLQDSFAVAAGWPNPMQVQVVDDCGSPMVAGSVVTTFSNGDPPLNLTASPDGTWSGTWQARNTSSSKLTVTATAVLPDHITKGSAAVSGGLRANQGAPVINPGAVVNSAGRIPQTPLAPGSLISILGSGLATAPASSSASPALTQMAGTSVLLGGEFLPLLSVADDHIDAVLPYDISVNTLHQLIVQRGSSVSIPEPVTIAAAAPGIFTKDGSGQAQGIVYAVASGGAQTLAEPATPAHVGDSIVIECTGLGAIDQPVLAGTTAPGSPAAKAVSPVSVTIGGASAQVISAGLIPGTIGWYQVQTTVPTGVAAGDAVPVVLMSAGQVSPAVTMAVR